MDYNYVFEEKNRNQTCFAFMKIYWVTALETGSVYVYMWNLVSCVASHLYTVPLQKKVLKYFPFFGHNGDNARLDCPQLHQLGMFKIQIMPLVKMFKTQYVPKSFVYKLCRNIYDSKCVKMFKLGKQTNLGLQDPTNYFWSLP